jgi:mRNA-degrading endonuclease RelE of RelBE toxin-antitoxin system
MPYQIHFSPQSLKTLESLPALEQMGLIESLAAITQAQLEQPDGRVLGSLERQGKRLYRLRARDFRIYLERVNDQELLVQALIQKETWVDFAMRWKLPLNEEHLIEKNQNFWQYLEKL